MAIFRAVSTQLHRRGCLYRMAHFYSTTAVLKKHIQLDLPPQLVTAIQAKYHESQKLLNELKQHHENQISSVSVAAALGGMRGVHALVCETSTVDAETGLAYRDIPVTELVNQLPCFKKDSATKRYPMSEALLWLLLTGSKPTPEQVEILRTNLVSHMRLPEHVTTALKALPTTTHPMTQFMIAIAACQTESVFAPLYAGGELQKPNHWLHCLHDGLGLIAQLPAIAGSIYRRVSTRSDLSLTCPPPDQNLDWSGNLTHMIGLHQNFADEAVRMYMFLHADHEGGNVSAHTGHVVASALADPYTSFTAAMAGLAGPLHGLANQQALMFCKQVKQYLDEHQLPATEKNVADYIDHYLSQKTQVIPGYGHAVLRNIDPRFTIQQEFCDHNMQNNPTYQLLKLIVKVVPQKLHAMGKVKNPWPNVDAISGTILDHFGITEMQFYTTMFGVSRSLGLVSQIVWDRLLNLPIERPKSMTLKMLLNMSRQRS